MLAFVHIDTGIVGAFHMVEEPVAPCAIQPLEVFNVLREKYQVWKLTQLRQLESDGAMQRHDVNVIFFADQVGNHFASALPRAQYQPALGNIARERLQPVKVLAGMKNMTAKMRVIHLGYLRRRTVGEDDLARLVRETFTHDLETNQPAFFQDRRNVGDRTVVLHISVEFAGNPAHVVRPLETAGGTPQQTELEQAILFLEVHGKAVRALWITRRHQITIDMVVYVGICQEQVRVPGTSLRFLQGEETGLDLAALGDEFFIEYARQCQAGWAKSDTQGVNVAGRLQRVIHVIGSLFGLMSSTGRNWFASSLRHRHKSTCCRSPRTKRNSPSDVRNEPALRSATKSSDFAVKWLTISNAAMVSRKNTPGSSP